MEICTHLFSNAAKRTKSCTVQQINRYGFFFITFLLLMMSGCTQWGSSITPLKIFPATNLNPSGEKRSLPVMVRVYLLKSENAFARASFRQLWKQDKATLGKSVIWRKEFIVTPHKPITLKLKNSKKAKYVAVVAIFRQPQGKTWRDISEINPGLFGFGKQITVRLYRNQVKIQ